MLENGFVKLYRSILKWEWYDDANTFRLFVHLLLSASIEESRWHGDVIKRGELVVSYRSLSKQLKISEQSVRTALSHLKSTGEVTTRKMSKYTVVTVSNYEKFQQVTGKSTRNQQGTNNLPTGYQQQYKKVKEDIRNKESACAREPSPSGESIEEIQRRMRE